MLVGTNNKLRTSPELNLFINPVHLDNVNEYLYIYSLSNVIMADEKFLAFHQYLGYSHTCGTIALSTPSAII